MKKILYRLSIVILAALLTGCGTSQKMVKPSGTVPFQYNARASRHVVDGAIMDLLERPNEARFYYLQAAQIDSTSPGIHVALAENYFMMNQLDVAVRQAKKALTLDPMNLDALNILAMSYEALKQYDNARNVYQDIVDIQPNNIEALYYLTSLQVLHGVEKEALSTYTKMVKSGLVDPEYRLQVGHLFLKNNQIDYADKVYQDVQKAFPEIENVYLALAKTQLIRKNTEGAIEWYQKALEFNPGFSDVRAELFQIYDKDKNYTDAINTIEKLVKIDSTNLNYKLQLGRYYIQQQDTLKALQIFDKSVEDHPFSERAHMALAATHLAMGHTQQAVDIYATAIDIRPNFYRIRKNLRDIYVAKQDWDSAIGLYETLTDNDTTYVGAQIEIANLLMQKGDTTRAVVNVQKMMDDYADDWRVPVTMGRFHFILGENKNAAECLTNAIELKNDMPYLWVLRGLSYIRMNNMQAALENFESGAIKFPKDPEINYYAGSAFAREGKFSRAVSYYLASLENDPTNEQTALALAGAYDEIGQFEQAEELYLKLMEANRSSAIILNNYAYHLSVQGIDLDKALKLSLQAVQAEPNNPPYLDTLGWIYYQKNDYKQAKLYIEKALAIAPDIPEVIEHLGDVYLKLGEKVTAKELWQRAYDLDNHRVRLLQKIENAN